MGIETIFAIRRHWKYVEYAEPSEATIIMGLSKFYVAKARKK